MRIISVTAALAAAALLATPAMAEDAAGAWYGRLLGQSLVFHITRTPDGGYTATHEIPDQSDAILPVDKVIATPERLTFAISMIGAAYEGAWDDTKKAWVGHMTQGVKLPLTLTRTDAAAIEAMRPKFPQDQAAEAFLAQLPSEEVRIANPRAPGVVLAGVFSKPKGRGPFPAVVLIAGSGPHTRDENVAGHKLFAVLAADLNRRGVAVLRYDKRGAGASTGQYWTATTQDFASDAEAALDHLAKRRDVDKAHIGLIGHSEGGAVAPIVAARNPKAAFVVLLAAPGEIGADLLLRQQSRVATVMRMPAARVAEQTATNQKVFDIVRGAADASDARDKIQALTAATPPAGGPATGPVNPATDPARLYTTPWMFAFLRQDPAPPLKALHIPVLALNGSLDLQVTATENLAGIRQALAGKPNVTIQELPGLNHLFQTATTGSPAEYGRIQETLSPLALSTVGRWIEARTGGRRAEPR